MEKQPFEKSKSEVIFELLERVCKLEGITYEQAFKKYPNLYPAYKRSCSVSVGARLPED